MPRPAARQPEPGTGNNGQGRPPQQQDNRGQQRPPDRNQQHPQQERLNQGPRQERQPRRQEAQPETTEQMIRRVAANAQAELAAQPAKSRVDIAYDNFEAAREALNQFEATFADPAMRQTSNGQRLEKILEERYNAEGRKLTIIQLEDQIPILEKEKAKLDQEKIIRTLTKDEVKTLTEIHRIIGQIKDRADFFKLNEKPPEPPKFGSPEWVAAEKAKVTEAREKAEAKIAQAKIDLAEAETRLATYQQLEIDIPGHPQVQAELTKIKAEIKRLEKLIPPDPATAKTIVPGAVQAPPPEKGSREWVTAEHQKDRAKLAERVELGNKQAELEREFQIHPSAELRKLIDAKIAAIKKLDKEIPKELLATVTTKEVRPLSAAELAAEKTRQREAKAANELNNATDTRNRVNLEINAIKRDPNNLRIPAKQRELLALRKELDAAEKIIADHSPKPPEIRAEVEQLSTKIEAASQAAFNLVNSYNTYDNSITTAELEAQIKPIHEKAIKDSAPFYDALKEIQGQLSEKELASLPDILQNADDHHDPRAIKNQLNSLDPVDIAKQANEKTSFWQRRILGEVSDPKDIEKLKALTISAKDEIESAMQTQEDAENEIISLSNTISDRKSYLADFGDQVNALVKNGSFNIPKNINDDERSALHDQLSKLTDELGKVVILNEAAPATIKKFEAFRESILTQYKAIRDNISQPTGEARPDKKTTSSNVEVEYDRRGSPENTMLSLPHDQATNLTMKKRLTDEAKKYNGPINSADWATKAALNMLAQYEHIDRNTLKSHLDSLINNSTRLEMRRLKKEIDATKKQVGQAKAIVQLENALSEVTDKLIDIDENSVDQAWDILLENTENSG